VDVPAKRGNVAVVEVEPEGFGVELVGELATRLDHLEDPVHAGRVDAVEVDGMGVGPGPPVLLGHLEDGNAQHPGRPVSREDVGREEVPAGAGVVGVVAVGAVDLVLPQRALVHRVLLVGAVGSKAVTVPSESRVSRTGRPWTSTRRKRGANTSSDRATRSNFIASRAVPSPPPRPPPGRPPGPPPRCKSRRGRGRTTRRLSRAGGAPATTARLAPRGSTPPSCRDSHRSPWLGGYLPPWCGRQVPGCC
jgi:hypothetical protein